jgi:hypothetical protein
MLYTLIRHLILDKCIDVIFNGITKNFQTERSRVVIVDEYYRLWKLYCDENDETPPLNRHEFDNETSHLTHADILREIEILTNVIYDLD